MAPKPKLHLMTKIFTPNSGSESFAAIGSDYGDADNYILPGWWRATWETLAEIQAGESRCYITALCAPGIEFDLITTEHLAKYQDFLLDEGKVTFAGETNVLLQYIDKPGYVEGLKSVRERAYNPGWDSELVISHAIREVHRNEPTRR